MAIKGGKWEMSDAEFERQFAEATRLGKVETASGAYVVSARYDKLARRIVIELANGVSLLVPVRLIQGLQTAKPKELAEIEILGAGSGLYWPQLAVDVGVAGLLQGNFGANSLPTTLTAARARSTRQMQRPTPPSKKPVGAGAVERKRSRAA